MNEFALQIGVMSLVAASSLASVGVGAGLSLAISGPAFQARVDPAKQGLPQLAGLASSRLHGCVRFDVIREEN